MGSDNQGCRHYSAVKQTRSQDGVFPMVRNSCFTSFQQTIPRN
jgi:hypothetical protein